MNEIHRIDLPRIVLVGRGVIEELGNICKELGLKGALVVTGRQTYEIAGKRARAILKESDIRAEVTYVTDADMETVERVRKEVEVLGADTVIGVGGGRTIDVAKLSAVKSRTFFVSVPTAASHDGIASCLASVKGLGRPYSVRARSPIAVVADSRIIAESPYRFTASGCGDVISKAVAVKDWRLARDQKGEYYGEYAGSLALMSSSLVKENASQIRERLEEGYRTLLEALVSCGVAMSIAGSSRPCSGSAHMFSHALDMIAPQPALHGEQCGIGAIMMAKLHGLDWAGIRDSLKVIGAPTTADELGIPSETIVKALVKAREIRPERYTILNKVILTPESAESLAKVCQIL